MKNKMSFSIDKFVVKITYNKNKILFLFFAKKMEFKPKIVINIDCR